jgi:hypothetical protein
MTKNVTPHWNWRTIKSAVETTAQPVSAKGVATVVAAPPYTHGAPACAFAEAEAAVAESGRMREHDYLGDGVYAALDEAGQIWLRTQRETGWHKIALEPQVWANLVDYVARVCDQDTKGRP